MATLGWGVEVFTGVLMFDATGVGVATVVFGAGVAVGAAPDDEADNLDCSVDLAEMADLEVSPEAVVLESWAVCGCARTKAKQKSMVMRSGGASRPACPKRL